MDVNRKPQRWLHVDEEISNSWLYKISSVRLEIEILKLQRHKLKFVLRYYHLQTSKNSEFAAFLAAPKLPTSFAIKLRPCEPVSVNCLSELRNSDHCLDITQINEAMESTKLQPLSQGPHGAADGEQGGL